MLSADISVKTDFKCLHAQAWLRRLENDIMLRNIDGVSLDALKNFDQEL